MAEDSNFLTYRKELKNAMLNPPCLPFLGNFLTQIAHAQAFMAIHGPKKNTRNTKDNASSAPVSCTTSPDSIKSSGDYDSSRSDVTVIEVNTRDTENVQQLDITEPGTDKTDGKSHNRSDSDDSGVVLSINRLSRTSDELVPSPRESALSSPEEENRTMAESLDQHTDNGFHDNNPDDDDEDTLSNIGDGCQSDSDVVGKSRDDTDSIFKSAKIVRTPSRKSKSVDESSRRGTLEQIRTIINNRPPEREPEKVDKLYENELLFWRYQIATVQYRFTPRTYIRRYLMNSPYNAEEDNYRISLKREPPIR